MGRFNCVNKREKVKKVVEYGIEALKAIWHRGAVDADGKSGDGAGIQIEIAPDFLRKNSNTGHTVDEEKEFALVWFFYQELIIQTKKMQRNNRVCFIRRQLLHLWMETSSDKPQRV